MNRLNPKAPLNRATTLIFDLDGTLVDSRPGILACFRYAFQELERPAPSEDTLISSIGRPFRSAFHDLLNTSDPALVERAVTIYRSRYATTGLYEATLYAGIPDALSRLARESVYVATSKAAVYASRVIEHFGLARYFRHVYGPDLHGQPRDKASLVKQILLADGIKTGAVVIGDRSEDMEAARANGLSAIGVLWGYGSHDELLRAGAETVCATPAELVDVLRKT